jgi:hypothetical protein
MIPSLALTKVLNQNWKPQQTWIIGFNSLKCLLKRRFLWNFLSFI